MHEAILSAVSRSTIGTGPIPREGEDISTSGTGCSSHDKGITDAEDAAFDVSKCGVIDPEQLDDLKDIFGNEAFVKLLVKFSIDLRRRLVALDDKPSRADVSAIAHAMISSAGSLGFTAFSDLCRSVEGIAQGDSDMDPSLVAFDLAAGHVLRTIGEITGSAEP